MDISAAQFLGFVLAFARASAWIVIVPPFSNKAIPAMAKVGLAGGLGLAGASAAAPSNADPSWPQLMVGVGAQVVAGLVLGFLVSMMISAVQAAGALVGLFGGLSLPPQLDPLSMNQATPTAALYEMIAMALLFASDGHVLLVRGFLDSFAATGVSAGAAAGTLTHALTTFFVGALEIAAPLLAVLFAAHMALGLLTKASPQLNVMQLSFPVQLTATIGLLGLGITVLPGAVGSLLHQAGQYAPALFGGGH